MTLPRVFEGFAIGISTVAYLVSLACTPAVKFPRTAHDFALNDSEGARIRLSDYKGRVVLLNFWANLVSRRCV
jgi:cytochrome oxidase Cu insertion factor (SCO1/SenC/PrrC family)